ncbi:IS5 family transposase [Lederbergia galactosidilyticus]|nr:IS5 family transposase [Lederbergia galactosidilytica]
MSEPNNSRTDKKGFILGVIVTPSNVHDSHILKPLVEKIIEKVRKHTAVAADAACKTLPNRI